MIAKLELPAHVHVRSSCIKKFLNAVQLPERGIQSVEYTQSFHIQKCYTTHICFSIKKHMDFLSLSPSLFSTVSEAHARSGHCRPSVTFLQTSLRSVTCVLRTCVLCTHVPSVASKSSQPFALIRPGRDLSSCACIEKNCFL